jgi:hypothetical protein
MTQCLKFFAAGLTLDEACAAVRSCTMPRQVALGVKAGLALLANPLPGRLTMGRMLKF